MSTLVWFRQDLRIDDHPALEAALKKGDPIVPIYIRSPEEEGGWPVGAAQRWWLHHSLISLQKELADLGLSLVIRQGDCLAILRKIGKEAKADALFWNRRYEPWAIKRDAKIKSALHEEGMKVHSFNGSLLFEPWTISTKQGKPYQVFTPFWKNCLSQPEPPRPLPKMTKAKGLSLDALPLEKLDLLPHVNWDAGIQKAWKPGTSGAKEALTRFIKDALFEYPTLRDRPDLPGTSHLSPYLHMGEISPGMVWHAVKDHFKKEEAGSECYLRQLIWREFAYHLLYHFPTTVDQPLHAAFTEFPWEKNPQALQAWQKGLTGYPIVDAGMRELWTTGWMHNRVRMIVGSFLVKDLRLSWLEGAKWFWDTLVDADMANNTLGWQWVAGCGADAAPYFRVFNPIAQGEKFDPEGAYVRRWIPELSKLPNAWIHRPWEASPLILKGAGITLGQHYPYPLVDHAKAREAALKAFSKIRKSGDKIHA